MFVGLISLPCSSFTILERHEALRLFQSTHAHNCSDMRAVYELLRRYVMSKDTGQLKGNLSRSVLSCGLGSLVVWGLLWSGVSCGLGSGGMRAVYELLRRYVMSKDTGQLKGNLSRSVLSCGLGSLVVWGLLWSGVWWYEGRLRAAATLRDEQGHRPAEGKSLQVCALLWSGISCGLGSGGTRAVYELLRRYVMSKDTGQLKGNLSRSVLSCGLASLVVWGLLWSVVWWCVLSCGPGSLVV